MRAVQMTPPPPPPPPPPPLLLQRFIVILHTSLDGLVVVALPVLLHLLGQLAKFVCVLCGDLFQLTESLGAQIRLINWQSQLEPNYAKF